MGAEEEGGVKQGSEVSGWEASLKEYLALPWDMGKREKPPGKGEDQLSGL